MGILNGIMAGVGQGLQDIGNAYIKQGFKEENDARALQSQKDLNEQQNRLLMQRQEALADFKIKMAEKLRQQQMERIRGGVEGVVGKQFDDASSIYSSSPDVPDDARVGALAAISENKQAAIDQGMSDPGILKKAAMSVGEFDVAKSLDGMNKPKLHNVGLGQTVLDDNGNVVYDGAAKLKQQMEEDKQAATLAGKTIGKGSSSSSSSGAQIDKIYDGVRKASKDILGDLKNPYADIGDDKAKDTALKNATIDVAARISAKQGAGSNQAVQKASEMVNQYDTRLRGFIENVAGSLFSKDGKIRPEATDDFKKIGVDTTSKTSFMRTLRDKMLSTNDVLSYLANPEEGDKKFDGWLAKYQPAQQSSIKDEGLDPRRTKYGIIKDASGKPIQY